MLEDIQTAMIGVRDHVDTPEEIVPNVVHIAAQAALLLIDKYATLTSECELYIIAIGAYFDYRLLGLNALLNCLQ